MTRRAELVDPVADGRWEAFVARASGAGVFHHRAWLDLLSRTYGYPMTACCVVDASGAIRAGAPLALVGETPSRLRLASLPFSEQCPPLPAPQEDPLLAHELVLALDDVRRSVRLPAELRGPVAPHPAVRVAAHHRAQHVPLGPDAERQARRLPRGSRILGGAERATREGLVVERRTDARALGEFHRLQRAMSRRSGAPIPPRHFVLGFAHLFDRGLGYVLLVRDGDRAVAGAVFLVFNSTLLQKYSASDGGLSRDVMLVEAIRWGSAAGMQTLDLGRSEIGAERLLELRRSWSAEEREVTYHRLGDPPPRTAGRRLRSLVAPLIRRNPPMVSRVMAEALFRRTG